MLKIQQIFPKLYRCLLYVVFHNLKPQNAGLVDVKKDLNSKRSKGIFVRVVNVFVSAQYLEYRLEYFDDTSELCRIGHDDLSRIK